MYYLQDFVRSTRKYWVHTEDVSRVKYIILQHLPVFLQNTMAGETDSQLVNSVRRRKKEGEGEWAYVLLCFDIL